MQKIWIYGDSFSASDYPEKNTTAWPNLLSTKYEVINRSQTGAGQDTQFNKLLEDTLDNDTSDDILIFIAPDRVRFNFDFLVKEKHQHGISLLKNVDNFYTNDQINFVEKFYYYYVTKSNLELHDIKNILAVAQMSKNFKKTLYWPSSVYTHIDKYKHVFAQNNFVHITKTIFEVSKEEGTWDMKSRDVRKCHLSDENNSILANMISAWIEHNQDLDISQFVSASK